MWKSPHVRTARISLQHLEISGFRRSYFTYCCVRPSDGLSASLASPMAVATGRDPPGTMAAAETCDCTLCRSVAGCWVSGLCQRSTPLMRLAHTPTALYPSHLRRRQLIHNGNVIYYTKILAQKSMGFEKWTRRAHSAEKTAAQGAAQGAAGDSPLKQAWTDHIFFYTSTLLHGSNIPSRHRGRRWSTGG